MGHAGELETAMMLHLCPDKVRLDRAVDETDFIATTSFYMDWIEPMAAGCDSSLNALCSPPRSFIGFVARQKMDPDNRVALLFQ